MEHGGWQALLEAAEAAPGAELRLEAEDGVVAGGLHVTELRRARIDAIDCGLGRRAWEEAQMEVLSGGAAPVTGATLAGLLRRSAAALGLDPDMPLVVEAAPGGGGIRRYRLGAVAAGGGLIRATLEALRPACRPREAGCCGPAPDTACCG